jgi:hypothetical protein
VSCFPPFFLDTPDAHHRGAGVSTYLPPEAQAFGTKFCFIAWSFVLREKKDTPMRSVSSGDHG